MEAASDKGTTSPTPWRWDNKQKKTRPTSKAIHLATKNDDYGSDQDPACREEAARQKWLEKNGSGGRKWEAGEYTSTEEDNSDLEPLKQPSNTPPSSLSSKQNPSPEQGGAESTPPSKGLKRKNDDPINPPAKQGRFRTHETSTLESPQARRVSNNENAQSIAQITKTRKRQSGKMDEPSPYSTAGDMRQKRLKRAERGTEASKHDADALSSRNREQNERGNDLSVFCDIASTGEVNKTTPRRSARLRNRYAFVEEEIRMAPL